MELPRLNRWWVYLVLIATYHLVFAPLTGWLRDSASWATYSIPSASMMPTLQPGDYVVAWRNYYRTHDAARGDVAVYRWPRDQRIDYVKRVVGLPGDHVELTANQLSIDAVPVPREKLETVARREIPAGVELFRETLGVDRNYLVLQVRQSGQRATFPSITVPEGRYFVLGDNRDNSIDSRDDGPIPRANLQDRVIFIYWSRDWRRIGSAVQ